MTVSPSKEAGFTFVELIVVIGIFSLLLSIAYVSLSNVQIISINNSAIEILSSDIKTQQIKAMTGDTEGRGLPDNYGIKIFPQRYVFFHGVTYNPVDPYNFEIPIDTGYTLSSTFPQDMVLFASGSGELVGFIQNQNTISVTNTATGQSRTIRLNKYGTVTSIN